jgi:cytidylate kinase
LQDLLERDARDQNRASAPLIMANDAVLLETDNLTISQAVNYVLDKYQRFIQFSA